MPAVVTKPGTSDIGEGTAQLLAISYRRGGKMISLLDFAAEDNALKTLQFVGFSGHATKAGFRTMVKLRSR